MYDNVDFLVAFGLGDGPAGEDGDGCDVGGFDHVVEDSAADQTGRSREDEMHFDVRIELADQ